MLKQALHLYGGYSLKRVGEVVGSGLINEAHCVKLLLTSKTTYVVVVILCVVTRVERSVKFFVV